MRADVASAVPAPLMILFSDLDTGSSGDFAQGGYGTAENSQNTDFKISKPGATLKNEGYKYLQVQTMGGIRSHWPRQHVYQLQLRRQQPQRRPLLARRPPQ